MFNHLIISGSRVEQIAGVTTVVNHKGRLRSMPDEDARRDRRYIANDWREPGTRFTGVSGTGLKRLRDENEPFAGRQALRSSALGKVFM